MYAQTYEKQGELNIAKGYYMKVSECESSTEQNLELLKAESALHFAIINFKDKNSSSTAQQSLQQFSKKAKSNDHKEYIDLARVNLGMFDGTYKLEEYKKQIQSYDYNKFLGEKLTYKNSSNP